MKETPAKWAPVSTLASCVGGSRAIPHHDMPGTEIKTYRIHNIYNNSNKRQLTPKTCAIIENVSLCLQNNNKT